MRCKIRMTQKRLNTFKWIAVINDGLMLLGWDLGGENM